MFKGPLEAYTRLAITGGPSAGKTTLALKLAGGKIPHFCTDPHPGNLAIDGVVYTPPGSMRFDESISYVMSDFLCRSGPWILEGCIVPHALRRFKALGNRCPVRTLVLLSGSYSKNLSEGQQSLAKAIETIVIQLVGWDGLEVVDV